MNAGRGNDPRGPSAAIGSGHPRPPQCPARLWSDLCRCTECVLKISVRDNDFFFFYVIACAKNSVRDNDLFFFTSSHVRLR